MNREEATRTLRAIQARETRDIVSGLIEYLLFATALGALAQLALGMRGVYGAMALWLLVERLRRK